MTNRITLDLTERLDFAEGRSFGDTGPYERLRGRAWFAVDPRAPAQAGIVDIDRAPVNADGLVECVADVCILKPADPRRGNGGLLFDYGNRGNKRALQFFNDAPASNDPITPAHAGNGFLMRRGYTVVWGAWQGDLIPGDDRVILDLPVATDGDRPLTGIVRTELIASRPGVFSFPLSGRASTRSHPTVSMDTTAATLTRRRYPDCPREPIDPAKWRFARLETGAGLETLGADRAIVPSDIHVWVEDGFEPGWIYELIYTARDPLVLGLGHLVVRDLTSFLKYGAEDASGRPNPVGPPGTIRRAYSWGRSQTGRCIRDFVYLGFNADATGRKVFDGVLPHVAGAGRMWMNHRFANAVVPAGQQYEDHHNPADRFPFSYAETTDHLTGKRDAILKRPETDPLVMHSQSATEYWQRRGSLVHTDTRGNDLEQPEGARVYFWSSSQHLADPNLKEPSKGVCTNLGNVVRTSMLFRAMLDAMDRWAKDGTPPPASRIPRRADGTAVDMDAFRRQFPAIPGVLTPREPNRLPLLDFGPEHDDGVLTLEPPDVVDAEGYTVLVPAVDADGNDVPGVRAPMVEAPLATYTGWNIRSRGWGHGAMHEFSGSTIPLPDTPEEARMTGDPRRSIRERYGDAAGYVAAIRAAAERLVADGLMLEEDVERCAKAAEGWDRPRHDVRLG